MALATTRTASSWPTTRRVQDFLHPDELRDLALEQARDGDAGPAADHLGDVLGVDLLFQHALVGLERGEFGRRAGDVGARVEGISP